MEDVTLNAGNGSTIPNGGPPPVPVEMPANSKRLVLREWSVSYAYSSFYIEEIGDLDVAAAALVRSGVATSVYVADGSAYWLKGDELRQEVADLRWREHETHAHLGLPKDIDGWAAQGLARALLQRFSEKRVVTPLPGPQHEYLRASMEPSLLGFGDEHLVICPTLKLYKTGVFSITYEAMTPEEGIGVAKFIEKYVNLFARWCDEAWVPAVIARVGATTQLHRGGDDRETRKANLGMLTLMRAAAAKMAETIKIDDFEFSLYPTHKPLDDFLATLFIGEVNDVLPTATSVVTLEAKPEAEASREMEPVVAASDNNGQPTEHASRPTSSSVEAAAGRHSDAADPADPDEDSDHAAPTQSYILSDMFDNAEYAVRAAIDPPREGKGYVRHGLNPGLTRGNYWQCRPQVSIEKFDDQPATASAIRERFGDDLGSIMARVPNAPSKLARAQLGDSLRPFEDHSLHVNSAISLCVYASSDAGETHAIPAILGPLERACTFEVVDYIAMRCRQLDQRATLATSVAEARAVRTDLGALENLTRTAFRASELNEATVAACERLRLPTQVVEVETNIRKRGVTIAPSAIVSG